MCFNFTVILNLQVTDYDVVVNGIGELVDQLELLESESLSCRVIFNCTQAERELSTSFFVFCLWKNAKCRKFPLYPHINSKNESKILEPGSYYLLRVSHKFPLQEKVCFNCIFNQKLQSLIAWWAKIKFSLEQLHSKTEIEKSCRRKDFEIS